MERSRFHMPQYVRPVVISVANFDKLLKEGRSFEEYFQAVGEQAIDFTHEAVLPAKSDYPSAAEMYDAYTPGETPVTRPDTTRPASPSETTDEQVSEIAPESKPQTAPGKKPESEQEAFERMFDAIPLAPPSVKPAAPQPERQTPQPQPEPETAHNQSQFRSRSHKLLHRVYHSRSPKASRHLGVHLNRSPRPHHKARRSRFLPYLMWTMTTTPNLSLRASSRHARA